MSASSPIVSRVNTLSASQLDMLWEIVTKTLSQKERFSARLRETFLTKRFLTGTEFGDLLESFSFSWHDRVLPLDRLAACADVPMTWSYGRPSRRSGDTYGFRAVATMDALAILILLEQLGLPLDLRPCIDVVGSTLKNASTLSTSELAVFQYLDRRGKWPPRRISTDDVQAGSSTTAEHHRTVAGYRVTLWRDATGVATAIECRAPRYRPPRPEREVICDGCGAEYVKGNVDSTDAHRKEHRIRMRVLDPEPCQRLASFDLLREQPDLVRVTTNSPQWMHAEMYERARAFRREFRYDFTQWGSAKGDDDPRVQGFLFVLPDDRIVGACAFRWRPLEGAPARWGLQWIWIAPGHRRSGLLRSYWPLFRQEFGDFQAEAPLSDAMEAFLESVGDSTLVG